VSHETEPLAAFTIFGHEPKRVQGYARFLDRRDYGVFAAESDGPASETGSRGDVRGETSRGALR
jgi:hypothetical protein